MTALLFQINDQTVPADDASWYTVAPCGCTSGVMLAVVGDTVYADETTVWKHLTPNAEQRRREQALGFKVEIGLRKDVRTRLVIDCEHTPKWGVEKTPIPDGHQWARENSHTGRSRRLHLVPDLPDRGIDYERHVSLCSTDRRLWSAQWHMTDGLPECTKCARNAVDMAKAATS